MPCPLGRIVYPKRSSTGLHRRQRVRSFSLQCLRPQFANTKVICATNEAANAEVDVAEINMIKHGSAPGTWRMARYILGRLFGGNVARKRYRGRWRNWQVQRDRIEE